MSDVFYKCDEFKIEIVSEARLVTELTESKSDIIYVKQFQKAIINSKNHEKIIEAAELFREEFFTDDVEFNSLRGLDLFGVFHWLSMDGATDIALEKVNEFIDRYSSFTQEYLNGSKNIDYGDPGILNENELLENENELLENVRKNPRDAESLNNLGVLYSGESKFELAIQYYSKALDIEQKKYLQAIMLTNIGLTQARIAGEGFDPRIEESFRKSIELDPQYASPYLQLGKELLKLYQYQEAIKVLEAYNLIDNQSSISWGLLGCAYIAENEKEKGKVAMEKCIEIDPKNLIGLSCLGGYCEEARDNSKAIEYYEEILRITDPVSGSNPDPEYHIKFKRIIQNIQRFL